MLKCSQWLPNIIVSFRSMSHVIPHHQRLTGETFLTFGESSYCFCRVFGKVCRKKEICSKQLIIFVVMSVSPIHGSGYYHPVDQTAVPMFNSGL